MVRPRSIPLSIVLSIITCGIYGIYWFVSLTDEVNEVTQEYDTSGIVAFLLSLVTCGIYSIYWGYKMGDKLDRARMRNNIPAGSFPILFLVLNIFGLSIVTCAIIQSELNHYTPVQPLSLIHISEPTRPY